MTKEEWMMSQDPSEMLFFLKSRVGRANLRKLISEQQCERKLRLFLVACCRRIFSFMSDDRSRRAVDVVERYVDGRARREELGTAQQAAAAAYSVLRATTNAMAYCAACPPAEAARIDLNCQKGFDICVYAADIASMAPAARSELQAEASPPIYDNSIELEEKASQAAILRDLVGIPFRSPLPDATQCTPTVIAIAALMYRERRFEDMTILADALEDAGWTDAEVLGHCRGPGPHVPGCWVVDLILSKDR